MAVVLRPDDDGAFTLKASAQYTFAMMVDAPPVPGSVEYTLMVSPEWSVVPTTVVTMNRTGRFSVSLPLSTPAAPPPPSPNFGVEIEVEYLDAEVRGIQIPLVSFYVRLRP
jgi:hypothetical protein